MAGLVTVYLCDDAPELRELMRTALEHDGSVRVIGEAGDAPTAIEEVAKLQPQVLLHLYVELDGSRHCRASRRLLRTPGVIVFSGFLANRMERIALASGADRYLEKGQPLEELREMVLDLASEMADARSELQAQCVHARMAVMREHDIVVFGATGFVGKLTAAYLASAPRRARGSASAAARSEKLERARGRARRGAADWPLVVADSHDAAALRRAGRVDHASSRRRSARTASTACRWSRRAPRPARTTPT